MLKGTFYRIDDQDLLELFLQTFGAKLVLRGGPSAMERYKEDTLDELMLYLPEVAGDDKVPAIVEFRFSPTGGDRFDQRLLMGKLLGPSAAELEDFIREMAMTLENTREGRPLRPE